MDLSDNFDLIEQCLDGGDGAYDCSLLEELIGANDGGSSSSSSDSGNYSPSSSSGASSGEVFHHLAASSATDGFASLHNYPAPFDINFGNDNANDLSFDNALNDTFTADPADLHSVHPWENGSGGTFVEPNSAQMAMGSTSSGPRTMVHESVNTPRKLLRINGSGMTIQSENLVHSSPHKYHLTDQQKPVVMVQLSSPPSGTVLYRHPQQSLPSQQISQQPVNLAAKTILVPTTAVAAVRSQPYPLKRPVKIEPFAVPSPHPIQSPATAVFAAPSPVICATPHQLIRCPSQKPIIEDDFVRKKEDRKLRNRASAQLSRQRKREEQDRMRLELDKTRKRCEVLEVENKQLKQKITQLQTELNKLNISNANGDDGNNNKAKMFITTNSGNSSHRPVKIAGVCMMLLCVMMVPNYEFLPSYYNTDNNDKNGIDFPIVTTNNNFETAEMQPHHHGRTLGLLPPPLSPTKSSIKNSTHHEKTQQKRPPDLEFGHDGGFNVSTTVVGSNGTSEMVGLGCADSYLNSSQSIKLNEDLTRWISRHEQTEWVHLRRAKLPSLFSTNRPALSKIRIAEQDLLGNELVGNQKTKSSSRRKKRNLSPPAALRHDFVRLLNERKGRGADGALLKGTQPMVELVEGIKGQAGDNTLTILALRDYWLMPPGTNGNNSSSNPGLNITANNGTTGGNRRGGRKLAMAPKLSIILPALSPSVDDASNSQQQLSMMRIECEVVGTSVFYLNEDLVKSLSDSASWPTSYDDILFR